MYSKAITENNFINTYANKYFPNMIQDIYNGFYGIAVDNLIVRCGAVSDINRSENSFLQYFKYIDVYLSQFAELLKNKKYCDKTVSFEGLLNSLIEKLIGLESQLRFRNADYRVVGMLRAHINILVRYSNNCLHINSKDMTYLNKVRFSHFGINDLYKCYSVLCDLIGVSMRIFKIRFSDLNELYAYWCLFKIISILKRKYKLIADNAVLINNKFVFNFSVTNKYEFVFGNGNERVDLYFRCYKNDSVIRLSTKKKRITLCPIYNSDLTDKHLEIINNRSREEKSALLYPCLDERKHSKVWFSKSVILSGSGVLPLFIGSTSVFEAFLSEFISQPLNELNNTFRLEISDNANCEWNKFDVLVGSFGSELQFERNYRHKYYYVPAVFLENADFDINYVALYQSKRFDDPGIRYYGKVVASKVVKRSRIPIPLRRHNFKEDCVVFKVDDWLELEHPIKIKSDGVYEPRMTNMFLLQNCDYTYELFNISSLERYNCFQRIKTALRNYSEFGERLYDIGDTAFIYIENESFTVINRFGKYLIDKYIPIADFDYSPKKYLKMIFASIEI